MTDLSRERELARQAALRAKDLLLSRLHDLKVESSQGRDIKLNLDRESDDLLREFFTTHSPYPILLEESGLSHQDNQSFRWVIDPLDGSFNFFKGIPFHALSIALCDSVDTPLEGVILSLASDELYETKNGEAYLNESKISTSSVSFEKEAVLATGFPAQFDFSNLEFHMNFLKRFKKVRMLGSATTSLAYVACGKIDAYYEKDIRLWDIAAGLALVKAAGGTVHMRATKSLYCYEVLATNGHLQGVRLE